MKKNKCTIVLWFKLYISYNFLIFIVKVLKIAIIFSPLLLKLDKSYDGLKSKYFFWIIMPKIRCKFLKHKNK